MDFRQLSILSLPALEDLLHTSTQEGLTDQQVAEKQSKYGFNVLNGYVVTWWHILKRQWSSPFLYLLLIAAVISFFLQEFLNGIIIIIIICINLTLGFIQEYRAERALYLLRRFIIITTQVKRNNIIIKLDSKELVPGDIVMLQAGDQVPADIRIIKESNLSLDESSITGESVPAKKIASALDQAPHDIFKAANIALSGTTVTSGKGTGIVFATGMTTMLGSIASLTALPLDQSNFQRNITQLSKFMIKIICFTLVGVLCAHLIIKGAHIDVIQLLLFALALAVSVTPEALPVVTTCALTEGSLELAEHKVVVKRLSALEDLGSIDVLCADKTGTLTENKLTLIDTYAYTKNDPLEYAFLAVKNQHMLHGHSFEAAIIQKAETSLKNTQEYTIKEEIPFDPIRRFAVTFLERADKKLLCILRGAYEEVIKLTQLTQEEQIPMLNWMNEHGKKGHRIIAVAYKTCDTVIDQEKILVQHDFITAGLLAFEDPIKPTATASVQMAQKMGIALKILTGDSQDVSEAVAHTIGLITNAEQVITGPEFEKLSLEQKEQAVYKYVVFARILPQQKYEIIELLKKDHTVGFLGEGINDVPALHCADVGIVVQHGTDIAKDAADIVLLHHSLRVIVEGIAIGRKVFANTHKYLLSVLTCNFGNFYSIVIASLLIDFLPMLPLQILLVNLLSDLPMIAIATDTVDPHELERPNRYNIKDLGFASTIFGITSSVCDFIFFSIFYTKGAAVLQTNWSIISVLSQIFIIYSLRTKLFCLKALQPSRLLILLSVIVGLIIITLPYLSYSQRVFSFTPPIFSDLMLLFGLTFIYFIATETVKLLYYHWIKPVKKV
ncbi:MAG: HAD-IC family P-type ATPase [Candidatus Babeliaceae bacterium]